MNASQVKKIVDLATSMGKLNDLVVQCTTVTLYRNSQSSVMQFDDANECLRLIRINNDSTRKTTGAESMQVVFVDYADISAIWFTASPKDVKDNESSIGTFDQDILKEMYKIATNEHQAEGFAAPPTDKIYDENGHLIKNLDANGNEIKHYDTPNVPSLF